MALVIFYLLELLLVAGVLAFVIMQGYILWRGAPYVSSTAKRCKLMVDALDLKPGQKAVDLGSGNGQIVEEMAGRGIDAYGFEINPWLVWRSKDKGKIYWKDYWRQNLSGFDGVTIYGLPHIMERLEKKLRRELRPGAKVVVETWKFPHWKPSKIIDGYVFLYKV